ncbi:sugar-binding transcriptional regulator [Priestia aryabhattai]|uniref:sugar-binding transcriptional regulator n=1 Tax=Priestia aryabhattai TaxID=412384 RepID=UPI0030C9E3BD
MQNNDGDTRLLTKIASMYYIEELTQSQISKKMNLERSMISRLLKKARSLGIVEISVHQEHSGLIDLEARLESIFNLKEVIIVPETYNSLDSTNNKLNIGKAAARYLDRIIKDGDIVGLALGTTMLSIANALNDTKNVKSIFVPLVGGSDNNKIEYQVNIIASKFAESFGAEAQYISAPVVTTDKRTKEYLIQDASFTKVKSLWSQLDIAIVGIGAPIQSSNLIWTGAFGNKDIDLLNSKKAVGDILSRFYDIEGNIIYSELDERIISLDLSLLKDIDFVIGVAESVEKAPSILGALRGKFINVLITSESTARKILELNDSN